MSTNLKTEILRGISGIAGAKLINLSFVFISSILLARNLGPEGYGAYIFIMSLVNSLALLSYIGLPTFMVREIAKYEQSQKWGLVRGLLRKSQQFVSVISILLILLIAIVSINFTATAELDRWRLLLTALPLIPVIALMNLRTAALRGLRNVILSAIPEMILKPAIFLIALLWLIFIGKATAAAVIVANFVAALGSLSIGTLLLHKVTADKFQNVTLEYKNREWLTAIVPFIGLAGMSFFNVEFVNIFLGISGTNSDVAIFRAAANIALIVGLPLTLIESVVSPYITRLYYKRELVKLQRLIKGVSLGALLTSAVPTMALLLFGHEIILLIYGSDYASAYGTLVVIVLGYMIVNIVGLSMQLLYATKYQTSAFRISVYGAFITVLLCLFLIPLFGAIGAGIVLGFGKALRATLFVIEARRRLKIKTSLIW